MMQLGFVTAILPELDLEEVFKTAAEIGYDCVEVMCWPPGKAERRYAGVTHLDVTKFNESVVQEVHSLTEKYGVSISGLGYYPNPLSPDKEEADVAVAHLKQIINAASMLGVSNVNTFIGRDWSKSVEENWPRFVNIFTPLVEHAAQHNIYIGIENCPMLFTDDEWPGGKNLAISPKIWRRMFKAIPLLNFGLNFDPSHLVWMQMDYLSPMMEFSDRIFHVHAKDVRVDPARLNDVGILANPLEYHSPKLPGLGDVNWGQFFAVLGESGYSGPVCVEVEDRVYEGSIESRIQALQQSHTFLRNFIPAA